MSLISRLRTRRHRGQSLVELAFILPVMLLLLLGAIDLGRVMYSQITITNAAKEGALVASQGGTFAADQPCNATTNNVMCAVLTEASGGFVEVTQGNVGVPTALCVKNATYPSIGSPPNVEVSVSAPFDVITPIIGDIVGSSLTLSASAKAQCLVVPEVVFPTPTPTPACVLVPTVNGLIAPGNADTAITAVGLAPSGTVVATGTPNGLAKNQSPAAGTCVAAGSTISYEYRPDPTPTPTPTPAPTPSPTPSPTPVCVTVPNLVGMTVSNARSAWTAAGFTGSFTPATGQTNKIVLTQNQSSGSCLPATTGISVTHT